MAYFTREEIEHILQDYFDTEGKQQYVGARYITIFGRKGEDTMEWDDGAPYEPLTVVVNEGNSYVSRTYVPTGIDISDTRYWLKAFDFNAQVEQYRRETAAAQADIDTLLPKADFSAENTVKQYIDDKTKKLSEDFYVVSSIADSDAYENYKHVYYCTGTNDELVIQQAVNDCAMHGGVIHMSRGDFFIDSFPNTINEPSAAFAAISIPHRGTEVCIKGDSARLSGSVQNGTVIYVNDACYEALDANTNYRVFSSPYVPNIVNNVTESVRVENLNVVLPWNQKRIIVFDWFSFERVYMQFVMVNGYRNGYQGHHVSLTNPPDVAVEGSAGVRMTSGSNAGLNDDYFNVSVAGLYEGFKVGGEHVVMVNCMGVFNVYAYTFGNYEWVNGGHHPITLINCADERSVNLPWFVKSGNQYGKPQEIDLIGFNIERISEATPGGTLGNYAVVEEGQNFCGNVWFTIQTSYTGGGNSVSVPFWNGTDGRGFITRNMAQKPSGTRTERYDYAPAYLQTYFDTDLGAMLFCDDEVTHHWRYWQKSGRVRLPHSANVSSDAMIKYEGTVVCVNIQTTLTTIIPNTGSVVIYTIPDEFKYPTTDVVQVTGIGVVTGITSQNVNILNPIAFRIIGNEIHLINRSDVSLPANAAISGEIVYNISTVIDA